MKDLIRWILFIPTFVIVYVVTCIVAYYGPFGYITLFGPEPSGIIPWLWLLLFRDVTAVALATFASCYVAPKGRTIISGMYAIFAIFTSGYAVSSHLFDPFSNYAGMSTSEFWTTVIVSPLTTIGVFIYFAFGERLGWVQGNKKHAPAPSPETPDNVIPFRKEEDDSIG